MVLVMTVLSSVRGLQFSPQRISLGSWLVLTTSEIQDCTRNHLALDLVGAHVIGSSTTVLGSIAALT
jgi:hypothetical protein